MLAPEDYMRRALELAERGLYTTTPNPRVGCVIVDEAGEIIGEGWTQPAGQNHAEVQALIDAVQRGKSVVGATAYVTLEPCSHFGRTPPCCDALSSAGISRVVAAMEDPNPLVSGKGFERLAAAGIAVSSGLLEEPARALNEGFISRIVRGRPFVRLKIAASLDGKTALANGVSKWITGDAARADAHHWRARSCAVLTGSGTVLADNPSMNVRAVATPRQPRRIVLDSQLRTPADANILRGGNTLIVTASNNTKRRLELETAGAEILHLPSQAGHVDIEALLPILGKNTNELLVEAGAELNAAFMQSGLVDEYLLYLAPTFLGDPARGLAMLPAFGKLEERIALHFQAFEQIGEDLRVLARPA
ncbi:bifunctional diaminohydroxyphosphoribosylaminopyrimidine deaminase/5-amino-6-(5-phosphoribosylamino)uracil reductase RibD [Uliginosibacterium sp. H3]|uniref:Riboflavin biosynthesis protein RibD n=1 Tax=Uliginosibacterium silvisoli TaxID=3114758 RepID=A0ABU6K8T0_9RHOO|nr:bifunctional diaminohydroxyphosphoribosylaminopyrimidine deaminase/5-amino-6-(5-phosphoribosylamino)uracil reductase RibD [Uliginosibacterium sp. H3]